MFNEVIVFAADGDGGAGNQNTSTSTGDTGGENTNTGGGESNMLSTILMMVALVAAMYFMLIRPQKKKEKKKKEMLSTLERGDIVTTIGGIMGKITKLKDDEVYIETGMVGNPQERSTMRITKWAVSDVTKKADTKQADDDITQDEDSDEE